MVLIDDLWAFSATLINDLGDRIVAFNEHPLTRTVPKRDNPKRDDPKRDDPKRDDPKRDD